jgi:RNA polymerase sigma-70 factor (family 1)
MLAANDYTDAQLLDKLRNDDDTAFTTIYRRYWDKLYAAAYRKLALHQESEEIVQEIFLDLWKRRHTIAVHGELAAYLAVAVKYKVINSLAIKHTKASAPLDDAAMKEDTQSSEWLDYAALEQQLAETIRLLPEKCRLVFILSRSGGLNHRQIASKLGIAEKTVESHISRALRSLRTAFQSLFSFF